MIVAGEWRGQSVLNEGGQFSVWEFPFCYGDGTSAPGRGQREDVVGISRVEGRSNARAAEGAEGGGWLVLLLRLEERGKVFRR